MDYLHEMMLYFFAEEKKWNILMLIYVSWKWKVLSESTSILHHYKILCPAY